MEIVCYCGEELKHEDVVILDHANGLCHFNCYPLSVEQLNDIGTYQMMKNKYSFFRHIGK